MPLPDRKESPIAKLMLTVLGIGAELERKNIVSRLYSSRQLAIERAHNLAALSNPKLPVKIITSEVLSCCNVSEEWSRV